jgi:nitrite reductase/ring-hydroxylating ferredoxin subunit
MLIDVGRVEAFGEGSITNVQVAGTEIGIARWHDRFYAVHPRCPDQAGPLCAGAVRPMLSGSSERGQLDVDDERPILICPWHYWEFDLGTGQGIRNRSKLRTYSTVVDAGHVLVELRESPSATVGEPDAQTEEHRSVPQQ